jgi:S1-C subfamily serine protease
VVNIYTSKTLRLDPALRQYLRQTYGLDRVPSERRQQSLGSGIIVSQDGYVLTNNHMVEGADEVKVALADEKTVYDAKVGGTDPQTDVAVVTKLSQPTGALIAEVAPGSPGERWTVSSILYLPSGLQVIIGLSLLKESSESLPES